MSAKLRALEELQACWESQKEELEQRAEDGEEKAEKIEKYDVADWLLHICTISV